MSQRAIFKGGRLKLFEDEGPSLLGHRQSHSRCTRPIRMAGIECEICFNHFDKTKRRPVNLPCGHTFCRACMETSIAKESQVGKVCHLCQTPHNAETVEHLPFNFILEKLIKSKHKPLPCKYEEDEGFSNGKCLQHESNKNHFLCQTHNLYICAECMLDDHKLGICQLKSYKDELLERKETLQIMVDSNISSCDTKVRSLNGKICVKDNTIQSAKEELQKLQSLIETKKDEIKIDTKIREKYMQAMMDTQLKIKSLEVNKGKLDNATKKKPILEICDNIDKEIASLKDWLSTINNFGNEIISKDLGAYIQLLKSGDVILNEGEYKYSKIEIQNNYIHLCALQNDIRPTKETHILPHSDIIELLPSNPTVFMNISAADAQIGTVYIKLTCPPQWMKQMLQLCINLNGRTYKGAKFSDIFDKGVKGERIVCTQYVYDVNYGDCESSTNFISSLEKGICYEERERGDVQVYNSGPGFIIFTKEKSFPDTDKVMLGHVLSGIEILDEVIHKHNNESLKISEVGIALQLI